MVTAWYVDFEDYERRMMRICVRMKWTVQEWCDLSDDEKDHWYQWELFREENILQFTKLMSQQQQKVDASLLTQLFLEQL